MFQKRQESASSTGQSLAQLDLPAGAIELTDEELDQAAGGHGGYYHRRRRVRYYRRHYRRHYYKPRPYGGYGRRRRCRW